MPIYENQFWSFYLPKLKINFTILLKMTIFKFSNKVKKSHTEKRLKITMKTCLHNYFLLLTQIMHRKERVRQIPHSHARVPYQPS